MAELSVMHSDVFRTSVIRLLQIVLTLGLTLGEPDVVFDPITIYIYIFRIALDLII